MTDSGANTPEPTSATTPTSAAPDNEKPQPKRRKRTVISCNQCHNRKQKCDRELPCGNCKFRGKACVYDAAAPTMRGSRQSSHRDSGATPSAPAPVPAPAPAPASSTVGGSPRAVAERKTPGRTPVPSEPLLFEAAARWGYMQSSESTTTAGLLRKIDTRDIDSEHGPASRISINQFVQTGSRVRERYKSLIRQLPAKMFIDKLVDIYFREFNWQYPALDRQIFTRQAMEWSKVPFHVFSTTGPQELSSELRAFPALLFQVMATALLVIPDQLSGDFEALKYVASMTFDDLALDYSESGSEVLTILGKSDVTFTTVQAGFLRAGFLKYTAQVIPSWHAIRDTIGDAQEIGMHEDRCDPRPNPNDADDAAENAWLIQLRRRVYMICVSWDIHCAVVLGRPATVDWRLNMPSIPIDAIIPEHGRAARIQQRDEEKDPPTPLTRCVWTFKQIMPLRDIRDLERDGENPKDFSVVDALHQQILETERSMPSYFRLEGTNWKWDNHPNCTWLVPTRFYLAKMTSFSLLALHRPYIFNRSKSRTEALKAALSLLRTQNLEFQGTHPNSWKNFLLFYNSFEAIVLIATVYIFFPRENSEHVQDAMQHFEWTATRFDAMQHKNPLAKSAKGVIQTIFRKFRKVVENAPGVTNLPSIANLCASPPGDEPGRLSPISKASASGTSPLVSESSRMGPGPAPGMEVGASMDRQPSLFSGASLSGGWPGGNIQDFSSLAPPHPTEDLFFNSLDILLPGELPQGLGRSSWTALNSQGTGKNLASQGLYFGGDFGQDSVWTALNQYS